MQLVSYQSGGLRNWSGPMVVPMATQRPTGSALSSTFSSLLVRFVQLGPLTDTHACRSVSSMQASGYDMAWTPSTAPQLACKNACNRIA
jgi:hypothetical protein